jgi:hypothetical protein
LHSETPLGEGAIVTPRAPAHVENIEPGQAAQEFARRILTGWHYVAELSVLGQPVCACGQPSDYCAYRLLAQRCGVEIP